MTPESNNNVTGALWPLGELLIEFNEPQLALSFHRLATRFDAAHTAADRRGLAGEGLAYFHGMTSLNDLVIMNNARPDVAANRELDERRQRVYELLTQQL
mgnify:FL=1